MSNKKYVAIDEEGNMRNIQIVISEPILAPAEVLNALIPDKPILIKDLATRIGNEPVRYGKKDGITVVWTRLLEIQIVALWNKQAGDILVPVPLDRGDMRELEKSLARCVRRKWVVPLPWKLYIANTTGKDGTDQPYLILRSENGESHYPPLANIFPDGRICVGDNQSVIRRTPGHLNRIEKTIDIFNASAFTSDINPPQFREWVRYQEMNGEAVQQAPDVRNPLPIIDNWFTKFIDEFGW